MKVVVAPNAFKGSLTPLSAARAIEAGLRRVDAGVDCDLAPLSDGGDGFLEALTASRPVERRKVLVRGPLHAPVGASFALEASGLALVEAAQACGIALLAGDPLDPLGASTGGVGELIAEARQQGARELVVGIGGSASTDGGTGMARALGYRFLAARGVELPEGGGSLERLDRIDSGGFDPAWLMMSIMVACDVDNPLFGDSGAAAVYAPQKGADTTQVEALDRGLRTLASVMQRDIGADIATMPSSGAAGGLGGGLAGFLGARLVPGAAWVMEAVRLEERLAGADLLITGEGRLDGQSLNGKASVEAGRMARRVGVRAVALVGSTGQGWERAQAAAFDEVLVVTPEGTASTTAMSEAEALLADAAGRLLG